MVKFVVAGTVNPELAGVLICRGGLYYNKHLRWVGELTQGCVFDSGDAAIATIIKEGEGDASTEDGNAAATGRDNPFHPA